MFRGVDSVGRMDGRAAYPSISASIHEVPCSPRRSPTFVDVDVDVDDDDDDDDNDDNDLIEQLGLIE